MLQRAAPGSCRVSRHPSLRLECDACSRVHDGGRSERCVGSEHPGRATVGRLRGHRTLPPSLRRWFQATRTDTINHVANVIVAGAARLGPIGSQCIADGDRCVAGEREPSLSLVEYLFIDEARLDSYVEQIGPPVTYDKVPVWKVELGLTGPKAAANQDRRARQLTTHEKIGALLDHLRMHGLAANSRRGGSWSIRPSESNRVFVEETCTATRVFVPPKPDQRGSPGVDLWVSLPPTESVASSDGDSDHSALRRARAPGLLCLLQDYRRDDERPTDCSIESAYTVLESILWAISDQLPKIVLDDTFGTRDTDNSMRSRVDAWHRVTAHMTAFVADPIGTLERMGCRPGSPRRIRTLYRIREFGPEYGESSPGRVLPRTISTFGYPIFVAAEG